MTAPSGVCSGSKTRRARRTAASGTSRDDPRLHGEQAFTLQFFASQLAGATDGFRPLSDSPLGGFLVMLAELHLAKYAFALHLLLQHLESLIDIVIADENLHRVVPLRLSV
jgi:hypothetical protein